MNKTSVSLSPKGSTRLWFWEKGEKKTPFRAPGCCTESTGCNTEQKPEQEAVAHWTEKTEITAWKSQSTCHVLCRVGGKRMQADNKSSTDPYDAWLSTALQGHEKPAQGQRGTPKRSCTPTTEWKVVLSSPTTDLSPGILIVAMVMAKLEPA